MADWSFWLVAAGVTVILELFSGTFYLLMIAIGLSAAALAALLGLGMALQMLAAAVVGVAATVLLRRSRFGKLGQRTVAERDPNVNLDIGQTVQVDAWQDGTARVMYRGALWDIQIEPGAAAIPGRYTIRAVRGSCLIVAA